MAFSVGTKLIPRLFGGPIEFGEDIRAATGHVAKALICASWARQLNKGRKSEDKVLQLRAEKEQRRIAVLESANKTPVERAELFGAWGDALAAYRKAFEWQSTESQAAEILAEQNEIAELIASAKIGKGEQSTQLLCQVVKADL